MNAAVRSLVLLAVFGHVGLSVADASASTSGISDRAPPPKPATPARW